MVLVLKINTSLFLVGMTCFAWIRTKKTPAFRMYTQILPFVKKQENINFWGRSPAETFLGSVGVGATCHDNILIGLVRRRPNFSSFSGFLPNTPNGQRSPNLDN